VLWRIIEPRIDRVLHDALMPMAKSDDRDEATPAKLVLGREREFRTGYGAESRAEFNRAMADFVAHKVEERPKKKPALSLIGYDDMELSTVVERGAARIRNSADDSFGRIKMRIANLVGEPTFAMATIRCGRPCFFAPCMWRSKEPTPRSSGDCRSCCCSRNRLRG